MYTVTQTVTFSYGHRLMSYAGACRHAHGHNGRIEVLFAAEELDALGMVRDFTDIRREIEAWLERHVDHRMLLRRDDPLVEPLEALGEPLFLMDVNPTAEAIAKEIFDGILAAGVPALEVRLWETDHSMAAYAPPRRTQANP